MVFLIKEEELSKGIYESLNCGLGSRDEEKRCN